MISNSLKNKIGIHSMWQSLERSVSYIGKKFQFRLETWKRKREIARAYHSPSLFKHVKKHAVTTGIVAGVVAGGFLLYTFSPAIIKTTKNLLETRQRTFRDFSRAEASPIEQEKAEENAANPKPGKSEPVKKHIPPALKTDFAIIANKSTKSFYLLKQQSPATWNIVEKYFMAVGERDGKKERAGDKKTPEGAYFITGRKENSELPEIYGPLAFVLNYPNDEDRKFGRNGEGIWIHGTRPDSVPLQTRGCLELYNKDLRELSSYLKLGMGTPVIIINDPQLENPISVLARKVAQKQNRFMAKHKKYQDTFKQVLNSWEKAWESRDIEQYAHFYDTSTFFGQGLHWNAWKEKKERTFTIYSFIEVGIEDITLADFSDSTAVVKFIQTYTSDAINVQNGKKLSFINRQGAWKIKMETTFPQEEHIS
ncbi:MAG: L,D-transpeptidase family protein [Chitinivibrionales bacterium]|nr:L,D-transpeptidase family protein [Chitinivibrionales bacterium]